LGKVNLPCKAKLVTAIFFSDRASLQKASLALEESFGDIDYRGEEFDFTGFTKHYAKEMGLPVIKSIWSFKNLISRESLADIKLATNELERKLAHNSGRSVNIDPGYLLDSKLVLATTKDFSHRIHLKKGIFAEITLIYNRRSGYEPMPWTYGDYKSKLVIESFEKIRSIYLEQREES